MAGPPPQSWEVDPWRVRAFDLAPGVWQLRLPLPWSGIPHVNAYVLEREDGVVLVDCGSAGHLSHQVALTMALAACGHELHEVRTLACTHAHTDHCGLAEWVVAESGCELLMHPATEALYDGMREPRRIEAVRRDRAVREGVPQRWLADFAHIGEEAAAALAPVAPSRPLRSGASFVAAGAEWRALETPGHAPNHVCLVADELGLTIVGDLVAPVFGAWFDYGYTPDPVAEYLASLDRLGAAATPRLALPGHGRPMANLELALATHRDGVEALLAATRAALAAGPATGFEVTRRAVEEPAELGEPGEPFCFRRVGVTIACLRHLRRLGVVERDEVGGVFRYALAGKAPVPASRAAA